MRKTEPQSRKAKVITFESDIIENVMESDYECEENLGPIVFMMDNHMEEILSTLNLTLVFSSSLDI